MYEALLAVDRDEERATAQASAVADLPGIDEVRATLLHVFGENPTGASVGQVAAVRRARERLREAGVAVELRETSGDPAEEILDAADDIDADVVVVGGRKRTPAGKVLFGSVTQGVVLGTDRPVLVCGPKRSR